MSGVSRLLRTNMRSFGVTKLVAPTLLVSLVWQQNEHLRRSLVAAKPAPRRPQFRVDARPMGIRPEIDLSNIEQLLEELDGPARR